MRRLTFEYRIYPNKKQVVRLQQSLLLAQRMYNHLLEKAISTYKIEGRRLTKFEMCNYIMVVKGNEPIFKSANAQVLQNCADRLSKAFDNFFRRVKENKEGKRQKPGFPRFKSSVKSITYPQSGFGLKGDGRTLYLCKIGDVKIELHRPIQGQIKTLTVVHRRSGKWFVLFSCIENDQKTECRTGRPEIGIDVGIRHFITTSEGEHVDSWMMTEYEKRRRRRLNRGIDRKVQGSHNREKARARFARHMEWESNRRQDFLQKTSRELISKFGTIALESLDIKQMILISPCPDEINRQAWGSLTRMLEYKAESAGTRILFVERYSPTSQICSRCHEKGRIGRRETTFHCVKCGLSLHRDINAAKNILRIAKVRAGHARSDAWEEGASTSPIIEMRVPSLNQELYVGAMSPTESSIS